MTTAVYVLYRDSECIYVGASSFVEKRLKSHPLRGRFTRYELHPCEFEKLQALEQHYIDTLAPSLNKLKASQVKLRATEILQTFTVYTTDENIRRLDEWAERLRRSRNSLLNEAIEMLLEHLDSNNLKQLRTNSKKAGAR